MVSGNTGTPFTVSAPAVRDPGNLLMLETSCFNGNPTLTTLPTLQSLGWVRITPNVLITEMAILIRFAVGDSTDDAVVNWASGGSPSSCEGRIRIWRGATNNADIYQDLATIVHNSDERQTLGPSGMQYNGLDVAQANCLLIAYGKRLKSAAIDVCAFTDLPGFQILDTFSQAGNFKTCGVTNWWQQTNPQSTAFGSQETTIDIGSGSDTGNHTEYGITIALKSAASISSTPSIDSVNDDLPVLDGQTSVSIKGNGFGATQGVVIAYDGAVQKVQTITLWTNTEIRITCGLGNLRYGVRNLSVSTFGGITVASQINISPPSGKNFVNLASPFVLSSQRITSIPDLQTDWQLEWSNVTGGFAIGDVAIYADGEFIATPGSYNFSVRVNDGVTGWGSIGVQMLGSTPPVITSNPSNRTVNQGQTAAFSVVASGGGLVYQWYKGTPPAPPVVVMNDPVTVALAATGSGTRYDVHSDAEMDVVPWALLTAGSVVNIFWKLVPYKIKPALRAIGNSSNYVIVNGVTDALGNQPDFDAVGAKTAAGCNLGGLNNIFNAPVTDFGERLGFFVVKRGYTDDYFTYEPKFIKIQNLDLSGARNGASYVPLKGGTDGYVSTAAIYILHGSDIIVENCRLSDCGLGIFTMAKDNLASQCAKRVTVKNCAIFGNGVSGSYLEHNAYLQSIGLTVEGNYFGQTRSGSLGSTLKTRSSGDLIYANKIIASQRALDLVQSEESNPGVSSDPQYGVTHVFGNEIINDAGLGNFALAAVHFGGDHGWEEGPTGTPLVDTTTLVDKQRAQMCFYNNTYIQRASLAQSYRTELFGISLKDIRVDIWNNIIVLDGTSNWQLVQFAGQMHVWGGNIIYRRGGAPALANAHDTADAAKYSVTYHNAAATSDPLFVNYLVNDFHLTAGSPAVNAGTGMPAGITWPPARISAYFPDSAAYVSPATKPANKQFHINNQTITRTVTGAIDLGCYEQGLV